MWRLLSTKVLTGNTLRVWIHTCFFPHVFFSFLFANEPISLQGPSSLRRCSQGVRRTRKTKNSCPSRRMTCWWWGTRGRKTRGRAPCCPRENTARCRSAPCNRCLTPSISEPLYSPQMLQNAWFTLRANVWLTHSLVKICVVVDVRARELVKLYFLFGQVVPEEVPGQHWMLANRKGSIRTLDR